MWVFQAILPTYLHKILVACGSFKLHFLHKMQKLPTHVGFPRKTGRQQTKIKAASKIYEAAFLIKKLNTITYYPADGFPYALFYRTKSWEVHPQTPGYEGTYKEQ